MSYFQVQIQEPANRFLEKFAEFHYHKIFETSRQQLKFLRG